MDIQSKKAIVTGANVIYLQVDVANETSVQTAIDTFIERFGALYNSPHQTFGGHKKSGLDCENSIHGLMEYSNWQTITLNKVKP